MKILRWLRYILGWFLVLIATISFVWLTILVLYHYWALWLTMMVGYLIGILCIQEGTKCPKIKE